METECTTSAYAKESTYASQTHQFIVDMFVTPFQGADVVLGVDWLKELGPVTLDYKALTISFILNGQWVVLSGEVLAALSICSSHLRQDISTNDICELFLLHVSTSDDHCSPPSTQPSTVNALINEFSTLFNAPSGLPPTHSTDHHIVIQQGQGLVNVRPYRYPHFQKSEISRMIN